MKIFKLPSRGLQSYTKPGRLTDILALIQVLAFDEYRHRSEKGIKEELQGKPTSTETWTKVAQEQPEFFRVHSDEDLGISLVARHVLPKNQDEKYVMPPEFVGQLLSTAIQIYDRQVKLDERWTYLIPIYVVLIGAFVRLAWKLFSL